MKYVDYVNFEDSVFILPNGYLISTSFLSCQTAYFPVFSPHFSPANSTCPAFSFLFFVIAIL